MLALASAITLSMDEQERQVSEWSVLLWSQSQNALHVEQVRHMLTSNRRAYADDRRMDYVPIFFGSDDHCSELADKIRNTLRARAALRAS